jgi:hypothetical protein
LPEYKNLLLAAQKQLLELPYIWQTLESLVVILHFLAGFPLHIHLSRRTFSEALMSLFLEPKVKALWLARNLRDTDGDGVYPAEGRKKGEERRVK